MFNRSKKKGSSDPVPPEAVSAAAPAPAGELSTEIVAVITAAIAAMMDGTTAGTNGLIIRKISRIHGEKVTWSNAGLMECIDSRKF